MKTFIVSGNAGSGKTTLLEHLKNHGIQIISSDCINALLNQHSTFIRDWIQELVNYQSPKKGIQVNKEIIRNLLTSSSEFKADLEHLLHAVIYQNIELHRSTTAASKPIAIEIPLYFESKYRLTDIHHIIIITADRKTLLKRLTQRPSLDDRSAKNLLHTQSTDELKFIHTSDIVINDKDELIYTQILTKLQHHLSPSIDI